MSNLTELGEALAELKEQEVYDLVEKRLDADAATMEIIAECNAAMVEIGKRFEDGKYFISELIMSGEIFKKISERLGDRLEDGAPSEKSGKGTVVMGTVKDDIHDIGKNIAISLLKGSGYEVVDLGVDVPAEKFIEALKESNAKVLGLSALLNLAFPSLKNVVDELSKSGLRDKVKVMIGGAPCNEDVRKYTGADYFAKDASAGVKICDQVYAA